MKKMLLPKVKSFGSRINGFFIIVVVVMLSILMQPAALATTYYVSTTGKDSNTGRSAGKAWKTIDRGDVLGVLNPGDMVSVAAGTYPQASANGVSLANCSGTAASPITYVANGSVLIDQSSYTVGTSYGFNVSKSGILIAGFGIKGAVHGIYLSNGSDNCTVYQNTIYDARCANIDSSGVYVGVCSNVLISGNTIYNIYDSSHTTWSPSGAAVRTSGSPNLRVFNNTIDNCYLGVFYYGTVLGGGSYGTMTVRNNNIVNCPGWGIVNPWSTNLADLTLSNNLLWGNTNNFGNVPVGSTDNLYGYDPKFVNKAARDYSLQSNSPAINAGVNVGLSFSGPAPDMGAIESAYTQNAEANVRKWICNNLDVTSTIQPFWFYYVGYGWSDALVPSWNRSSTNIQIDANRTQHTLTYTDPTTGLEVRCVAIEYLDYPAVEWAVHFRNTGNANTPVLNSIRGMRTIIVDPSATGDFTVYHADGSSSLITDFRPQLAGFPVGATVNFHSNGGRPSDGVLPFFNMVKPDGNGVAIAIGWTGQWQTTFSRLSQQNMLVEAGMIISDTVNDWTSTFLYPTEEIRTPAALLMWWSGGDEIDGKNKLRKLFYSHYTPKPGGLDLDPPVCTAWPGTFENRTEAIETNCIAASAAHGLPFTHYWVDAGWYTIASGKTWAECVGNWTPDPVRFPNGLKPVADFAHTNGYNFVLWFEPERAMTNTDVYNQHPSWLLSPSSLPTPVSYQSDWRLVNLGNADALQWAKTNFNAMIGSIGIDIYRQDFNMNPLYYWWTGEPANRAGINQIKYVTGLYDYLDYLRAQNPNLIIDNCASGGRRIDLEMMKRSVVLTRTDYLWEPVGQQSMTYGLAQWLPITGIGTDLEDTYKFRSGYGSHFFFPRDWANVGGDMTAWSGATQNLTNYNSVRDLCRGDFFPLTTYSTATNVWMAWQYDRSDIGQGMVQAFRRPGNTTSSMTFYLRGLVSTSTYRVTNIDNPGSPIDLTGDQMMTNGIQITLVAGASAVIKYTKL